MSCSRSEVTGTAVRMRRRERSLLPMVAVWRLPTLGETVSLRSKSGCYPRAAGGQSLLDTRMLDHRTPTDESGLSGHHWGRR